MTSPIIKKMTMGDIANLRHGRINLKPRLPSGGHKGMDPKFYIPKFQGDLQPEELMDRVAAVGKVLDFKEVLEDRRVSLIATKLIDEDLSVDWASPPIYDIYPDEEDLLEEVNLVIDT
jgi:hypothetical protein